jgi:hypothetical protein
MKTLLKFPLLALVFLFVTEAILPGRAIAGSAPVALPESGSSGAGDTFSPSAEETSNLSALISAALNSTLQTFRSSQQVPSVGDRMLSISSEKLDTIAAAISSPSSNTASLQEQISEEMDTEIDLSILGSSSGDLNEAIESINAFILGLNREQLMAAIESPTFMALLKMLGEANQAVLGNSDDLPSGGSAAGIIKISLPQTNS